MPVSGNCTVYDIYGSVDRPVITLVHGLGLTRATWDDHIPYLAEHYRVLNYDLYGHGDTAPPPRRPDLSLFAEQLAEVMDEVGIAQSAVVGFSLGGMINRRFAMDFPNRVWALGILNSPHERGTEAQKIVEDRAARSDEGGPGATLDATIERWFTQQFIRDNDAIIAKIRSWVLANDPAVYAQCRQVLAHGVLELIRPAVPIAVPSLVMTCAHDSGSTPVMSHAIASEIEGAETIIVPQLQHMGLVEKPLLFAEPMRHFLDNLGLTNSD
ncbi:MAG: alpha/beta fold hydrolase [Candidatus Puniceispirillum sp.]|nr:alpha/beta fold hydrolase [Candidatus Puniceispirillum sp.]